MSTDADSQKDEPAKRPKSWTRRLVRWCVLFVLVPYLAIVAYFAVSQRSFLYPARRTAPIRSADLNLPEGEVHDIVIQTEDGLDLNGWLFLADASPDRRLHPLLNGSATEQDETAADHLRDKLPVRRPVSQLSAATDETATDEEASADDRLRDDPPVRRPVSQLSAAADETASDEEATADDRLRDNPPVSRTRVDEGGVEAQLAQGRPLILYFPGNAGCRHDRILDCRDFTGVRCDVLLVDYRGYAENGGKPSEEALAADARTIWKYVVDRLRVPPDRVIVFGESLGGGVATRLTAEICRQEQPPAGLILSSTFSSMADVAAWHYPFLPVRWLLLDRFPSDERIGSVTCPIHIIHGGRDEFVPLKLSRKLFDRAPAESASGVSKQFTEIPTATHNAIPKNSLRDAVTRLISQNLWHPQ